MKLRTMTQALACAGLLSALLAACGGGGGGTTDTTTPPAPTGVTLEGTAASGAPMAGATITVTDANGKTATATAGADGKYSLTLTGFTAPVVVTASLPSGEAVKLYNALLDSLPALGQTAHANVTPLTDALAALAAGDNNAGAFAADPNRLKQLDPAKLAAAATLLKTVLVNVITELGLPADFDPVKSAFDADRASGGDKLLETVKVSVSDLGVTLTNVRVTVTGDGATASVTITPTSSAPAPLPKPTITTDFSPLDAWIAQINQCLALAPASRVSVGAAGAPTGFLGACAQVNGFSPSYKRNGYNLVQRWGSVLLALPQGAKAQLPELLGFFKSVTGHDQLLFRVAVNTSQGGTSYVEIAEKNDAGEWFVVGNQRNFDASVDVRLSRVTDASTYGFTPGVGPDQGINVGNFSRYEAILAFSFNQSGPNGQDVYAVRIKGAGLPANGLVLARSSSCGTGDYLAFYNDNGVLPAALMATATASATTSWRLASKPIGSGYKGTDFWNELRGRNSAGAPTTAPTPWSLTPVDLASVPELARYSWEVFTVAGGAVPSATFTSRIVTRVVGPDFAGNLPWATLSAASLEYANPAIAAKAGALPSVDLSWTTPAGAPVVTNAYVYGDNRGSGAPSLRMNVGGRVAAFGATSQSYSAEAETNGLGQACSSTTIPAFTATQGYREVGLRQTTERSLVLQQLTQHIGRPVQ